jgi:hypothetical protein
MQLSLADRVKNDLYILHVEDPDPELVLTLEGLETQVDWNEWYADNGYEDQVNKDFGPEGNDLAKELGIPYDHNYEVPNVAH